MKLFYDGYSFDYLASTHVFCPWSVLKFLDEPALGFRNYWYASAGRPTAIAKRLLKLQSDFPVKFDNLITATEGDLEPSDKLTELRFMPSFSGPAISRSKAWTRREGSFWAIPIVK